MSESSSAVHLAFEKLDGRESYNNWKFSMKITLIHENLWGAIEGYPDEDTSSVAERTRKDQKALAKICLMVKPCAYPYVRSAENAREAWLNLQKAYEDKGLSRRLSLLRTLAGMKLQNFKNMEIYVNEIMSASQKLADINAPLDDEFLAVIMLSGLTEDYDPMVMALESANIRLTSNFVKAKLLQDIKHTSLSNDRALYTKNKVFNKKKIVCFRCNKEDHFKTECPLNKSNKDTKNVKDKTSNFSNKSKDKDKALLVSCKNTGSSEDWYIDSGATIHLTNKKDWFQDFDEENGHSVAVASGQTLNFQGKGNVIISTKNGEKKISNVVYVPDLKTNLLSVSKMVNNGHVVVFNSTGCQVYDAENCLIKGEIVVTASYHNGLYRLDTSQIANLAKHTDSEEIWHKRLGHLNRISMNLLKKNLATGINFDDERSEQCVACLKGIKHQLIVPYTPEQNGVAERTNRTIVEKARCMMQDADSNEKMWAEAVNTAVYLKNRSPHKAVKGKTPQEIWTGEKVDLSHLKVFGCIGYVHVPKIQRNK
ncbi:uncharacterized protein LOC105196674 isoform X3 [Solenopsis invicta]|uniref:uncharacterized protein LOC105196674 isoform X3 n=1 Tax=Solenopsis invicta TaxID=13686 RepID=UPI00193EB546|nr:uncharacterized protein LOC105196674 isoform X3 [Solenopsis invicta]